MIKFPFLRQTRERSLCRKHWLWKLQLSLGDEASWHLWSVVVNLVASSKWLLLSASNSWILAFWDTEGVFGLAVFITQFSISINHSKFVDPTSGLLVWLNFYSQFSLLNTKKKKVRMSDEIWKQVLWVFRF